MNIFLIGPSGAGKSTVGQELALLLNKPFYDSDKVIEERAGVSISWIFDFEGEDGFRKRETKALEDLCKQNGIVLATGGGAILETANRQLLSQQGLVIYLQATVNQQLDRIHRKEHRPLLKVNNVEERLWEMRHARLAFYEEIAEIAFDTDGQTVKQVVKDILTYLEKSYGNL